ncbi:MAG: aminotransferase class III-fold pyridoxal phosphate-dependent enzyme [Anaerolineae bacterium]|nr:aminotransferase class III-fold pyridoxal phosphate-dependent enzyme [Anaerolineae bacterium]
MSLLEHTPRFSTQEAAKFARELYGLDATAMSLPSERDQNFLLEAEKSERFVLKVANALEDRAQLDAQNQAMAHLTKAGLGCSRVVPARMGELITEVRSPAGVPHLVRLASYVPGIPLGEVGQHSAGLLCSLGEFLGRLDRTLARFDHPAIHREFNWDLANALQVIDRYQSLIAEDDLRALIGQFVANYERTVVSLLPQLRQSAIHNDANNYNVIVSEGDDLDTRYQRVAGIIDFGDMVYSYTVGDLAVAIAYAVLGKDDPLIAAAHVVQGYHAHNPLQGDEMAVLFGMVCMRLCVSACMAAHQAKQRPDDAYLTISQQPILHILPKLARIPPRFAEATFRHACGLAAVPDAEPISNWLRLQANAMAPVLGMDLRTAACEVFDLSVGSPLVSGDPRLNVASALARRLFERMSASGAQVGIGRYNESRLLYNAPLFEKELASGYSGGDRPADERRTVHLGIDLFTGAGTPVYAPLAGTVYAFAKNDAPQDYGQLIVLQHRTDDGAAENDLACEAKLFYTLYGHLSAASLAKLQVGQTISQGQQIGTIGTADENGGWTPHLHFQIITDLLGLDCDFPGVCRASLRRIWAAFSPDTNLILGIPACRFPAQEPSKADTLVARRRYIGRNLSIGYSDPLKIERGWMQYLYDETGRCYLDAYNNVPHVGHCHPRVVRAGQQQMTVLNTNTRYLHDNLTRYAERLCATLPDPLSVCFFVNSGSEANELALRLARTYTGQRDIIVLDGAYHGHTTTLIDISPYKHDGPGGGGAPPWVHTVPVADVYRGPYKVDDPQAAEKYAGHVLQVSQALSERGIGLAGFIAESCPSVGGQIIFPQGYLAQVYRHVRESGGVCIADEVQTGYGRTGSHFYAFEAQGVVPDIVVLGKPIGNGHPIGAVITTADIAYAFDNGMEFFSTFGGSTVSCAIGLTVLDVVLEENLQAHASRVGEHMLAGLREFKQRYEIVGDVRGSGLFLGIELVRDRETLEPAGKEASFVANRMRDRGILLGTDGPYHNVVKIRPPMPFAESDADLLIAAMGRILNEIF